MRVTFLFIFHLILVLSVGLFRFIDEAEFVLVVMGMTNENLIDVHDDHECEHGYDHS